jgi:hypothetical protein
MPNLHRKDHVVTFITRVMAGCLGFLNLTQFGEEPAYSV